MRALPSGDVMAPCRSALSEKLPGACRWHLCGVKADFGTFRYPDPHLDYSGFRHTQKGRTTFVIGPEPTSCDVRLSVVMRSKADVTQTSDFVRS